VVVVGKPNPTDGMNWKKHHRSGKHPCQVNHRDGIYLLLDPLNCFRILFMYNLIRNKNNIFQWTGSLLYLPRKKHTNCSDSLRHWVKLRQDVNLRKSKYQLPIQWWVLYKQSTERQKKGGSYTGRRGGGNIWHLMKEHWLTLLSFFAWDWRRKNRWQKIIAVAIVTWGLQFEKYMIIPRIIT